MDLITVLGTFGSICSIGSFIPQAYKVAKTGETEALSLKMYILTVTGFSLWLAYGIVSAAWPIVVTNGTCLVLSSYILVMKLRSLRPATPATAKAA